MRMTAVLFCVLCAGAWSQAPAAEPKPQATPPNSVTPSEQQSAAAAAVQDSAAAAAEQRAATSAGTQAATTATPDPAKQVPTAAERELMSRGYKLEIRHGQRYFCRREPELGSRFDMKSCNTVESIEAHRANSTETVREMQANKPEINK